MLACKAKNLSPATIRDYTLKVQRLLEWCRQQGATELHDITPDTIRGYMVAARERGLADYSVRTCFAAHHAFSPTAWKRRSSSTRRWTRSGRQKGTSSHDRPSPRK